MASDPRGRGHGFRTAPFPPETRAPWTDTENHHHPADPSCAQYYCPVSGGNHSFRLLLEETVFQALNEEPQLRGPGPVHNILPEAEDSLPCLPFPKKLWRIVNSNQFASIWWEEGGTCIVINEKLFQKEVLERESPNKVFQTNCMNSFIRQLNLYGFSKMRQNIRISFCLTNVFILEGPVYVKSKVMNDKPSKRLSQWDLGLGRVDVSGLPRGIWVTSGGYRTIPLPVPFLHGGDSNLRVNGMGVEGVAENGASPSGVCKRLQLLFYCNPYFKRDSPHLLVRMKRRLGVKSALRQKGSQPEALESPVALTATERQDPASPNEDNEEIPKSQELDSPATQVRSDSALQGTLVTVPEPTKASDDAPVTQPAIRQPESSQSHITQLGDITAPAELPFVPFTIPSTHMDFYRPVMGVPALPPRILSVHTAQLPLPGLLPFGHHWVAVPAVAPGPIAFMSMLPLPPTPVYCCPHCHCVLELMPATSRPQGYPEHADYHG
ncbi:PREDICTED: heat shock transcription factor, X-linked-like [Galeopterus variegatus]|uniref:Heat shock transcription factor, X-linked-like n=1 Tax=Galeopterus variegatus TaxID=482537 RepID=A0ABM0QWT1_GALVR|nr:PREDICTED: heat shock transcription factor, X-linked-like [Galeopterus variegatus]